MRGKFITFEGCEGAGKSKHVRLLTEYLVSTGQDPVVLREPGGTQISEGIRDFILSKENGLMTARCEVILYMACRTQLIEEKILPALKADRLVICDRFMDSSIAYQGFGRELGYEMIDTLNKIAVMGCVPDATVFLDIEPEKAFMRKGGADLEDRLESESIEFHKRVYKGYKFIESVNPSRIINIKPTGSVQDTQTKIIAALKAKGLIK
ncbi:MAG: dTMP kinase [Christensenellales bacterium]|jgi:dTMP kinase